MKETPLYEVYLLDDLLKCDSTRTSYFELTFGRVPDERKIIFECKVLFSFFQD